MAASTQSSSYAVWKDFGQCRPAIVNGPPVEYGDEEEGYVLSMGRWFEGLEKTVRDELAVWPERLVGGGEKGRGGGDGTVRKRKRGVEKGD